MIRLKWLMRRLTSPDTPCSFRSFPFFPFFSASVMRRARSRTSTSVVFADDGESSSDNDGDAEGSDGESGADGKDANTEGAASAEPGKEDTADTATEKPGAADPNKSPKKKAKGAAVRRIPSRRMTMRGSAARRQSVYVPKTGRKMTTQKELVNYLAKTDYVPRPGCHGGDDHDPYREGHSLFRCAADGTGFVEKHTSLWPDTLPSNQQRDFARQEQAQYRLDHDKKPKWDRSAASRTTPCTPGTPPRPPLPYCRATPTSWFSAPDTATQEDTPTQTQTCAGACCSMYLLVALTPLIPFFYALRAGIQTSAPL